MADEKKVIGGVLCPACGAKCELRVNKNQKVYFFCDGTLENGCSYQGKYGARLSREMIAKAAVPKKGVRDHEHENIDTGGGDAGGRVLDGHGGKGTVGEAWSEAGWLERCLGFGVWSLE